jgi:predicted membrane protein
LCAGWDRIRAQAAVAQAGHGGDAMNDFREGSEQIMSDPSLKQRTRNPTHGALWGGIICVIGLALLLDHLGYVSFDRVWRYWPILLVVIGLVNLTQSRSRGFALILISAGTLLQLGTLGILRFNWSELWPLLIILVGGKMIWSSLQAQKLRSGPTNSDSATMNATAVFGGIERSVSSNDFRGGSVSAFFGGVELDFVGADIQGDEAILEVNATFGGVEIRVPTTWTVENRGQAVFGGYSENTRTVDTADSGTRRKVLIITGTLLFGGLEIKN